MNPRLAPKAILFVLATVFLVASCFAQDIPKRVRFTVKPGVATPIFVHTTTYAACTLSLDGMTDTSQALKLYADQAGTINFHIQLPVREPNSQPEVTRGQLQCRDDSGTETDYPIELRASDDPTAEFPVPASRPPVKGTIRPALTGGDALSRSQDDLIKAGYPPRPDPVQAPDAYAFWLRMVSIPAIFVPPNSVPRPDIIHTTVALRSPNWSGYGSPDIEYTSGLSGPIGPGPGSYDMIFALWSVPPVVDQDDNEVGVQTASSMWVGLDGGVCSSTCPNLFQAGTEQNAYGLQDPLSSAKKIGAVVFDYHAWWQIAPLFPTQETVNITVNPGDLMWIVVWISNGPDGQAPNPFGNTANFYIEDFTDIIIDAATGSNSPFVIIQSFPLKSTCPEDVDCTPLLFTGQTAEWIMERPTNGQTGNLYDLADYNHAYMFAAFAGQYVPLFDAIPAFAGSQSLIPFNPPVPPLTNYQFAIDACNQGADCTPPVNPVNLHLLSGANEDQYGRLRFDWFGFH